MTNREWVKQQLDRLVRIGQSPDADQALRAFVIPENEVDPERFASLMTFATLIIRGDPEMLKKTVLAGITEGTDAVQ